MSSTSDRSGRTYKLVELVGTSTESFEAAIGQAVADARRTIKGLAWFEVAEMRGHIGDDGLEYQAKVKVAFRVITDD